MPGHVLKIIVGAARCRVFDWRYKVRTCGVVSLDRLTIESDNARHGVFYHPTHSKFLFEVLGALDIDYERYRFIDLGSGKGRVLLVASEFPFREVLGVEFARELHEIACQNLRRLQESLPAHPRDTIIVYAAPDHGELIERETALTCVERSVHHNTYRVPGGVS